MKDQGQRGSCWAFSSNGGAEGSWGLFTGSLVSLSEQQLVDCSKQNTGCNDGLMNCAFTFYKTKAIAFESSYPYIARDGTYIPEVSTGESPAKCGCRAQAFQLNLTCARGGARAEPRSMEQLLPCPAVGPAHPAARKSGGAR